MRAQELRLGNLVDFDGQVCRVNGISQGFNDEPYEIEIMFPDGMFSNVGIEEIKPIILMSNMLEKFGFVDCKGDEYNWYHKLKCGGGGIDPEKYIVLRRSPITNRVFYQFRYSYNFGDFSNTYGVTAEFSSVHELQNLIYTLSGNELPIKEFMNEIGRSVGMDNKLE